jgi:hypothetical protein
VTDENKPKHADEGATLSLISNGTYDFFKNSATLYLPAIGTFYAAISLIWHLPWSVEVVGTLAALTAFLGTVLKISQKSYNASDAKYDGELHVDTSDPDDVQIIRQSFNLDAIQDKKDLILKVQNVATGTPPSV